MRNACSSAWCGTHCPGAAGVSKLIAVAKAIAIAVSHAQGVSERIAGWSERNTEWISWTTVREWGIVLLDNCSNSNFAICVSEQSARHNMKREGAIFSQL